MKFITNERIELAKELLVKTDFTINKAADCVGYENYSYFTRIFKRYSQLSPKAYRQQREQPEAQAAGDAGIRG